MQAQSFEGKLMRGLGEHDVSHKRETAIAPLASGQAIAVRVNPTVSTDIVY